jgi:hypothetical protein
MPKYPECWQSCGSCASGDVFVLELLVKVDDVIARDDNVLTLETGKVALDILSAAALWRFMSHRAIQLMRARSWQAWKPPDQTLPDSS